MSLYNDATMIFLGQAAAGGVSGKLHTVKPLEKLGEELITNGSFTDMGPGTGGLVANTSEDTQNGWTHHGSDSTAVVKIVDGVLKLINDSSTTVNKAYATNGSDSANILTQGKKYKISYRVVYNDNVESSGFRYYNGSSYTTAPSDVGKHSIIFEQVSTQLFILQLSTASSEIHIDDVSIKEVEQEADPFFFSRDSDYGATRVGHDGFIKRVRENLITYSNDLDNSVWSGGSNGLTVTSGQTGYDNTTNAYKLEKIADDFKRIQRTITEIEGVYTWSVYAKAGTLSSMVLRGGSDDRDLADDGDPNTNPSQYGNDDRATFDLANGTFTIQNNTVAARMDPITGSNGDTDRWYRCSIVMKDPTRLVQIYCDFAQTTAGYIYAQNAQLEEGSVATPYIHNLGSTRVIGVKEDEPRFDYYDTTTPRLLTEPKRTNLVKVSECVPETKNGVTLVYNNGVSPDSRKNSLKVVKSGTSANDRITVMDDNITLVSGKKYTISAFVKNIDCAGTTTLACRVVGQTLFRQGFGWASASAGADIAVDDDHGGSGTRTNKFAKDYGDGWWRIGFTFEADGTAGSFEIDVDRENANHTTSIETWGWQLEQTILNTGTFGAGYVTSYIPNFGASAGVTRNTEIMRIEKLQEKGLITNEQGTVFVDYDQWCTSAVHWDVRGPAGHIQYSLRMHVSSYTGSFQFQYKSPDTGQVLIKSFDGLTGDRRKAAMSWNRDTIVVSVNGSSLTTSIPSDIAENLNRFQRANNSSTMASPRSILIFDKQLSESELNELTTI